MILLKNKLFIGLGLIFLLAIVIRFLFFPNNIYFGFDQARDAFASQDIFKGNLKIVGPPTSGNLFHHGVLYYYIFGPIYALFNGNPEAVSFFLRIFNALGVFMIFAISALIFNSTVGIFAAILFAFSYEQTQFSLFLNHPSLAVISVLMFYFGLSYWIFKEKNIGIIISFIALGISIQFEFVELQLIPIFILFLIYFHKRLKSFLITKYIILSIIALTLPLFTFIIFEIKNNFYTIKSLPLFLIGGGNTHVSLTKFLFFINRFLEDNIFCLQPISLIIGILFLFISIKLLLNNIYRDKIVFLMLWFFGGFLIYFVTNNDAYYYNTGTSISLLIFTSFILSKIYPKNKIVVLFLLILMIVSNLYLISKNNPLGPNQKINPQVGLLLTDEKKVIDFIYSRTNHEPFAVYALTMPFNINTTWSYLFEWYGMQKYGYLPIWGGNAAAGYYGNLKINTARSTLPRIQFLIIEPKEGIPAYLVDSFLKNENIYTKVLERKKIGAIEVWVEEPK